MTPGECNECHPPQPHARSSPFRDAGRSRDRQEVTNRLARLSRCLCPRVVHHTCARACASALASGTALSRIHKRSNYIALTCVPRYECTCIPADLYVRVHIALSRNQDISGEYQIRLKEMTGLIRWTVLIILIVIIHH